MFAGQAFRGLVDIERVVGCIGAHWTRRRSRGASRAIITRWAFHIGMEALGRAVVGLRTLHVVWRFIRAVKAGLTEHTHR